MRNFVAAYAASTLSKTHLILRAAYFQIGERYVLLETSKPEIRQRQMPTNRLVADDFSKVFRRKIVLFRANFARDVMHRLPQHV